MPHDLRFSVLVLPNAPWPEFLRRCQHVESLGFDSLGLADHLVDWTGGTAEWFELFTQLAALAVALPRIRLATLVAQVPLRNPVALAHQALTADHVSAGRLDLGLGTGLPVDPSYRMMGIDNWPPAERVARLREYVALVAQLLAGAEVTHAGRFYRADRAHLRPAPVQRPIPLMIAAMGPVMLGIAARHAHIWNSLSFAKTFAEQMAETRARVAAIDAHCAAIGRDPATLRRSYLMFDPTARAGGGALAYYESEQNFRAMAAEILAAGMDEIALYYPALDRQRPMFEHIARTVVPELRERHRASAK